MLGGPIISDPDRPDYGSIFAIILFPCMGVGAMAGLEIGVMVGWIINNDSTALIGALIGGGCGFIVPFTGLVIEIIKAVRGKIRPIPRLKIGGKEVEINKKG